MKTLKKTYIWQTALLTTVLVILVDWALPVYPFMGWLPVFFFFVGLVMMLLYKPSATDASAKALNYMLLRVVRFMLSLILLVTILLLSCTREVRVTFTVVFAVCYAAFLIYDTWFFHRSENLKAKEDRS